MSLPETLADWLDLLESRHAQTIRLGLERVRAVRDGLGEDSGAAVTYQIVGEDEADIKLGLINISSPIARALIGKEEGDTAVVQAPGGERRYEIVAVKYL